MGGKMKKLLILLLVLSLVISSAVSLVGCTADNGGIGNDPSENGGNENNGNGNVGAEGDGQGPVILVPPYKDYGRDTKSFSDIVYSTPDIAGIVSAFEEVTAAIVANEIPFDEQVALIEGLEEGYAHLITMYNLTEIHTSKDASSEFWNAEYTYISTNYSSFSKAVEDMYVAAAQSLHKASFEDDYFGFSLDDYVGGGMYTDELVLLMAKEAELISEYNGLSTETVEITYNGRTAPAEEFIQSAIKAGKMELENTYRSLYESKKTELTKNIYVELTKTRWLIADELDCDSYAEVGYDELGHDYSPEAMKSFIADIKNIDEIFGELYYEVFIKIEDVAESDYRNVVNELYTLYNEMDSDIGEIYAYMLQHGLYDIAPWDDNRYGGAFTVYILGNNSPFIFMTSQGDYNDYSTLSHEFGHFVDAYFNDGLNSSLDLAEVYSQALNYLTLIELKNKTAGTEQYKEILNLLYYEMYYIYDILMYQGFVAEFEHLVYELDYDQITAKNIESLIRQAGINTWGYAIPELSGWDAVMMMHTVEYPYYVQSYCTSLVAALEIMLLEANEEGAGLAAFKTLVERDENSELTFEEELARAGIKSPLREGALTEMMEGIYRFLCGRDYKGRN